jgi:hypothetical protein
MTRRCPTAGCTEVLRRVQVELLELAAVRFASSAIIISNCEHLRGINQRHAKGKDMKRTCLQLRLSEPCWSVIGQRIQQ